MSNLNPNITYNSLTLKNDTGQQTSMAVNSNGDLQPINNVSVGANGSGVNHILNVYGSVAGNYQSVYSDGNYDYWRNYGTARGMKIIGTKNIQILPASGYSNTILTDTLFGVYDIAGTNQWYGVNGSTGAATNLSGSTTPFTFTCSVNQVAAFPFKLYKSRTGATNDYSGQVLFEYNRGGTETQLSFVQAKVLDATNQVGNLEFGVANGGNPVTKMTLDYNGALTVTSISTTGAIASSTGFNTAAGTYNINGTIVVDQNKNVTAATYVSVAGCKYYGKAATAPSSPVEGDMYYDTALHTLRCYGGSTPAWKTITWS